MRLLTKNKMSETLEKNITVSVRTPETKFSVELPAGSTVQDIINLIGFIMDKDVKPSNPNAHE